MIRRLDRVVQLLEAVTQLLEGSGALRLRKSAHERDRLLDRHVTPPLRVPRVAGVVLLCSGAEREAREEGHVVLQLLELPDRERDRHLTILELDDLGGVGHRDRGFESDELPLLGGELAPRDLEVPVRRPGLVEADRDDRTGAELRDLSLGPLDRAKGLADGHRRHGWFLLCMTPKSSDTSPLRAS